MQFKSLIFTAITAAVSGVHAQLAAKQTAWFTDGSGQCPGEDMPIFFRRPMNMSGCMQEINNTVTCNTTMNSWPEKISCVSDVWVMPTNSLNAPYAVQQSFRSAGCQGLPSITGKLTKVITSVQGTITPANCTVGGAVTLYRCTNLDPSTCTVLISQTDGECVNIDDSETRSVKMRCVPSGGLLSAASSQMSQIGGLIVLIPALTLIFSLLL